MPRHMKMMKDVVSCDKPRVGANNRQSEDFRMGQPTQGNTCELLSEYIRQLEVTQGSETSQYLQEKKTKVIPRVAASEMGLA